MASGKIIARAQTHYESASFLAFTNRGFERQSPYTKSDLMLTYSAPGSTWSLQGCVRNVEDSIILTAASVNALFGAYDFQMNPPRTYGVRATVNFRTAGIGLQDGTTMISTSLTSAIPLSE